jgi:NADH:ubiquinone oxidoreductase subunit 4 (subunit M)
MAKGRPALATLLMTTGIIALAVPGATTFAGEFLILLGVFKVGWGWAIAGAAAIVFAAMYMLRLISGVLHQERGPAVADEALDLRPGELAIIVPLVACLLALSVWPAAITERSFANDRPREAVDTQFGAHTAWKRYPAEAQENPDGSVTLAIVRDDDAPDVVGPSP